MHRYSKLALSLVMATVSSAAALALLGSLRDASPRPAPSADSHQQALIAESDVVTAVSGRVAWVAPALERGGAVERNQVILRLESRELAAVLEHAEAAASQLQRELDNAIALLERIGALFEQGVASQSEMNDALGAERQARAALRDAWLGVTKARRDLAGTEVRAPVGGRVIVTDVEVGQFVSRGARVALLSHETA